MKKYLLGTMMLVGAMAYGQGNQVVVPVDTTTGNATANLGIEVTGKVYNKTDKSLVVEIISAASPDGRGFAFQMPDMFTDTTGETVTGKFVARVETNGVVEALKAPIEAKLYNGTSEVDTVDNNAVTGTANDTTINYKLTGKSAAGDFAHNGTLLVNTVTGTEVGNYSDNSVQLKVKLTEQKTN